MLLQHVFILALGIEILNPNSCRFIPGIPIYDNSISLIYPDYEIKYRLILIIINNFKKFIIY